MSSIMNHADTPNILYPLQHGFRKFRTCETQLLEFIDDVTTNIENSIQTDILIMDFSKALIKSVITYWFINFTNMVFKEK